MKRVEIDLEDESIGNIAIAVLQNEFELALYSFYNNVKMEYKYQCSFAADIQLFQTVLERFMNPYKFEEYCKEMDNIYNRDHNLEMKYASDAKD